MGASPQTGKVITLKGGGTRQFRSKQERRGIVEETLRPGASVSVVARAHDVNANQVFKWRRQYREGRLEATAPSGALLPVKISDKPTVVGTRAVRRRGKTRPTGIIDIDLGHARVRIEGAADPDCVQAALDRLIR
jgi:transposase